MEDLQLQHKPMSFEVLDTHRPAPRFDTAASREGPVKLTVAMAAHNEERTIASAVSEVLAVQGEFEIELVVVDDGSTDRTVEILASIHDTRLVVLGHGDCQGKGAAVRSAASAATGTHILVFDADLEYVASDIPSLIQPVLDGTAHVVYGARVAGLRTIFPSFRYALGSKATTMFTNIVFDSWLKDMHTCLKLMPLGLFRQLRLSQSGFGLDTEITGEVLRRGIRPYEVPCAYRGRSRDAGKKISVRDGFECVKVALEVRLRGIVDYDSETLEPRQSSTAKRISGPQETRGDVEEWRMRRSAMLSTHRSTSGTFRRRGKRRARLSVGDRAPKAP